MPMGYSRRRGRMKAFGAVAALAAGSFAAQALADTDCGGLAGKTFGDATITGATNVAPPSSLIGKDPPLPTALHDNFCRVQGEIKPTADSAVGFEVWLPPASAWNGKYEGVGNGGFAGSFIYPSMELALEAGYAVSATNTGHSGSSLDSDWAMGHPEKIVDFGWRGIHETALTSKAIVEAYYSKAPAHAYFSGCSDGGREALLEAQRFPKDYDGIVAGAPANYWSKLMSNAIGVQQSLAGPGGWLSPAKLDTVTKAVVATCHGDGGYLDDPSRCSFDPGTLACKGEASDACLTAPELATLRTIYSGAVDASGKPVFGGYPAGGEAGPTAWSLWITGTEPKRNEGTLLYTFGTGFFSAMVESDPKFDYRKLKIGEGLASADQKTGAALDATDIDLGAFRAAGGKLLQYHGWSDAAIPATSSINYYEAVASKMGGLGNIQPFYRLFMAPGMQHCGGGLGPNAVGGVFGYPPPSRDPQHDVVAALAHWVEDGVAPTSITATSYVGDDPSKGVAAQHPWCAYPESVHYSGQGDRTQAASFTCSAK
jgi:hypothetical protein